MSDAPRAPSLIVRLNVAQTSTTLDTATPRHAFDVRVDCVKPSKMDINNVIMDYFINEGYPAAAQKFAEEANIQPPADAAETMEERVEIRNSILAGKIEEAVEKINDLDPELLDRNAALHFALLRLQLIELIRPYKKDPEHADLMPILDFATTALAPLAPTTAGFKQDFERTMALLVFGEDGNSPQSVTSLLNTELRRTIATDVNEALLTGQGLSSQDKLKSLARFRAWAESRARERGKDLPHMDIWATSPVEDTVMGQDGEG